MRYFLICLALEFLPPSAPKGVAAWSAWTVVGFSVWPLPIRQGALVSAERVGTGEGPHRQSRGHSDQSCVTKARAWGESLLSRVPQRGDGVQEDLCPKGEVTPGSASGWAAKTHGMGLGHVPEPYGVPGVSRALWGFLAPRGGLLGAPRVPRPTAPHSGLLEQVCWGKLGCMGPALAQVAYLAQCLGEHPGWSFSPSLQLYGVP